VVVSNANQQNSFTLRPRCSKAVSTFLPSAATLYLFLFFSDSFSQYRRNFIANVPFPHNTVHCIVHTRLDSPLLFLILICLSDQQKNFTFNYYFLIPTLGRPAFIPHSQKTSQLNIDCSPFNFFALFEQLDLFCIAFISTHI
jgi:hypothetical protein